MGQRSDDRRETRKIPSTIAREIARNGGRDNYRAVEADTAAYVRARRPKISILCARAILRTVITDKLHEQWSPQQISVWLRREHPGDPQMWVSHETIYRCLYIPSRKVFDSNAFHELRTDRPIRRPRGKKRPHGRGRIRNMVSIDLRGAAANDRSEPGTVHAGERDGCSVPAQPDSEAGRR